MHRFEGGAQGEHKMARALLPVQTSSAHWLAHPAFADAVERFLEREGQGVDTSCSRCTTARLFEKLKTQPDPKKKAGAPHRPFRSMGGPLHCTARVQAAANGLCSFRTTPSLHHRMPQALWTWQGHCMPLAAQA